MTIGGEDIRISVPDGPIAMDFAVQSLHRAWPKAIFVKDDDPEPLSYARVASQSPTEVIVYKDEAAHKRWDEIGFHESLKGTMIYLISDPGDLTFVIENDPCEEIRQLLETVKKYIHTAFPGKLDKAKVAA